MEVDNKATPTEVITDETKVETTSSENVKKTESDVGATNEKTSQSTVNNKTVEESTEEANSTISPIYSRWKSFSFSKVIENVKKQSETVKEVYQKDLSELVTTITTESQNLKKKINDMTKKPENEDASTETATPKENEIEKEPERISLRAKRNSSIINKMSAGINSLLNKNKPEAPQKKKKIFDRKEALINELQDDPLTYLIDPLYDPESSIERIQEYKKFTQKFDLFSYHVEIDKLLDEVEEVKYHHTTIVPARLPEEIFWQRYFFKLKELEESEELKKQLVKDVAANINEEEEIKWDSDSDDDDDKSTDIKIKKDETTTSKDKINTTTTATTNAATTTTTTAAAATDDKKTEDTDDDWDNWE